MFIWQKIHMSKAVVLFIVLIMSSLTQNSAGKVTLLFTHPNAHPLLIRNYWLKLCFLVHFTEDPYVKGCSLFHCVDNEFIKVTFFFTHSNAHPQLIQNHWLKLCFLVHFTEDPYVKGCSLFYCVIYCVDNVFINTKQCW